jgi:ArsR family transcriptional regulator, virulence genes transcriptional regulator
MRTCAYDEDCIVMDEVYKLQSEVLKILSNPRRLEIIHLLADGPREVTRLAEEMGISQPNVSQHLALMRSAGLVDTERDGREVHYRLSDPQIIVACETMRGVLMRRLARISVAATRTPGDLMAERTSVGTAGPTSSAGSTGIAAAGPAGSTRTTTHTS